MTGFRGQKFDFTGVDGEWYALFSSPPSMHVNMRGKSRGAVRSRPCPNSACNERFSAANSPLRVDLYSSAGWARSPKYIAAFFPPVALSFALSPEPICVVTPAHNGHSCPSPLAAHLVVLNDTRRSLGPDLRGSRHHVHHGAVRRRHRQRRRGPQHRHPGQGP